MPVVKLSGSYREVIQQLGLSQDFDSSPLTLKDYNEKIKADLPRICYAINEDLLEEMKEKLADTHHLDETNLIYRQGDLDGRFFSQSARSTPAYEALQLSALEKGHKKIGKNLAFSYVDDTENLCGFSMDYYNESQFIITVIRGVTQPIDKREVNYFTQPEFIPNHGLTKPETRVTTNLVQCVERATNCTRVNNLLNGIITEDDALLEQPFLRLKGRLSTDKNIEDKGSFFQRTDKNIEDKGSFFQRNAGNLILAGIAFLGVVAVLLTLTGVLAPVGLGLGIIAIAGAVVLGAFSTHEREREREREREIASAGLGQEAANLLSSQKTADLSRTILSPNSPWSGVEASKNATEDDQDPSTRETVVSSHSRPWSEDEKNDEQSDQRNQPGI